MTALVGRVPVERISEQARQAHPGRVAAGVVAWLLLGAGFVAARVCAGAWLGVAWAGCAVAEGWREGRSAAWRQSVTAREARRAHAGRAGPR